MTAFTHVHNLLCTCFSKGLKRTIFYLVISSASFDFYLELPLNRLWIHNLSLQVIAENLSEEEIAGLKQMFKMIDADNSGHITLEELKKGLEKVGANLNDSEIVGLMQAVSFSKFIFFLLQYSCW